MIRRTSLNQTIGDCVSSACVVLQGLLVLGTVVASAHGGIPQEVFNPGQGVTYRDPRPDEVYYPVSINYAHGFMGRDGYLIVWAEFDWTDYYYDNLARAVIDGLTGFIDRRGTWIIDPQFPYADRFQEKIAVVSDGEHFGLINKRGDLIVPARLDGARRFRDGLAAVQAGTKCGFIDTRGRAVIKPQFVRVRSFYESLAMVQFPPPGKDEEVPGMLAYINRRGSVVFKDDQRQFEDLGDFRQSLAKVRVGKRWGFIDKRFRLRIVPQFEAVKDFTENVAAAKLNGKWGYIDKRGKWVIQPQFKSAEDFSRNLGLVSVKDGFGFVNRGGRMQIPTLYPRAESFFEGLARVGTATEFGYIDVSGYLVWNPRDPEETIWNRTQAHLGRVRADRTRRGQPVAQVGPIQVGQAKALGGETLKAPMPGPRKPTPQPYLTDYLYEDELPLPKPAVPPKKN